MYIMRACILMTAFVIVSVVCLSGLIFCLKVIIRFPFDVAVVCDLNLGLRDIYEHVPLCL